MITSDYRGVDNIWFAVHPARKSPSVRLFAFPHGGGGASAFRAWPSELPAHIELWAFRPPGREYRHREPSFPDMQSAVKTFIEVARAELEQPYVCFGHSLGALMAFEVARALSREGGRPPEKVIVAGHSAPHMTLRRRHVHKLSDREMIAELKDFAGTPAKVLDDPDMMSMMIRPIRADFKIRETYEFLPGEPLSCPLVAFSGDTDPEVLPEQLDGWSQHTRGAFAAFTLPGSHFFVNERTSGFFPKLRAQLESVRT